MNEPFLLSNLIELQELDNEIFKLISQKSEGDTVVKLKSLELDFKKLQKNKQNYEQDLQLYFDAKDHIEKNIVESKLKIDTINEKLGTNLDASELQNYNLQKQNFEKNLLDYEKSLIELNDENDDFICPSWVGEEVSDDRRFSSKQLAKTPYIEFKEGQLRPLRKC